MLQDNLCDHQGKQRCQPRCHRSENEGGSVPAPMGMGARREPSDTLRAGGHKMPYALYVCLQDEDKIVAFTMDAETGRLTPQAEVPVVGGPSVLALSPDRHVLYVGHRTVPAIPSFRIDPRHPRPDHPQGRCG